MKNIKFLKYRLRSKKGQALVEFIFTFPLFLLVFLVLVQFVIMLNNAMTAKMALWLGLRGVSLPKEGGFFGPSAKYSQDQIKTFIRQDYYNNDTANVDINYSSSSYLVINDTTIEIKSRTPYLYQGFDWDLVQRVFAGKVKDGKIEADIKANMLKF